MNSSFRRAPWTKRKNKLAEQISPLSLFFREKDEVRMNEENGTFLDRYDIEISNTERRNSSIAIQDCYIVYLIESK